MLSRRIKMIHKARAGGGRVASNSNVCASAVMQKCSPSAAFDVGVPLIARAQNEIMRRNLAPSADTSDGTFQSGSAPGRVDE
jgi:hypothetical protein